MSTIPCPKRIRLSETYSGTQLQDVINHRIPHVGEQIFENLLTDDLIQCEKVSRSWKLLAEKILHKKWKGKLFEACEAGKTSIVKILLDHSNSDNLETELKSKKERQFHKFNAFKIACKNGHKEVVKLLLDHPKTMNIDFKSRDQWEWSGFIWACMNGHKEVVQLLIERNFKINVKTYGDKTTLMWACGNGHKDVVKLLLDHSKGNINVNARSEPREWTAFMLACSSGNKNVVKLLLDYKGRNINLNERDHDGGTAFMKACANGHKNVVKLLLDDKSGTINFNARDLDGVTAFIQTCSHEHKDTVKLLLKHAKSKGITIPKRLPEKFHFSKEIKDLVKDYHKNNARNK